MALFRIDQIVHELYVHVLSLQRHSFLDQTVPLCLEIISIFCYRRIFDHRPEVFDAAFSDNAFPLVHGGDGDVAVGDDRDFSALSGSVCRFRR